MGKPNKSVWIYSSVMLILAIALILLSAVAQNRTNGNGEKFAFADIFTSTAQQKIAALGDENLELKQKVSEQDEILSNQEKEIASLTAEKDKKNELIKNISELYTAYTDKDYKKANEIIAKIPKEQADKFIPGLYDEIKQEIDRQLED